MKRYYPTLLLLALLFTALQVNAQNRKVLVIGIDGCRSDALQQANTPNIDAVMDSSLFTLSSWHTGITVSGPAWSTILTGVHWNKHGVTENGFGGKNFDDYPPFPTRAKEVLPNLKCVQVVEWPPLQNDINNAGWDYTVKSPDGNTGATADSAVIELADTSLDALFVYFDQVDLIGHGSGFSTTNGFYMGAIEGVDGAIGRIIAALYARPTYATEDWLILITTDHGGEGINHGGNSIQERQIWWIAKGNAVDMQQITEADPGTYNCNADKVFDTTCVDLPLLKRSPTQEDIAVTALHHLLYDEGVNPETQTAWALDGKSWLKAPVGINGPTNVAFTSIYPNLTKGLVMLETNHDLALASIKVYDLMGREVNTNPTINGTQLSLDLSGNAIGIYVVKVESASGVSTAKVAVE